MLIGPWGHGPSQKLGDMDFGNQALVDIRALELRWFDYWLKGIQNGLPEIPPVTLFVMGANRWRYENEYPLARTDYRKMYLHSAGNANSLRGDGILSWSTPQQQTPDTFVYDPRIASSVSRILSAFGFMSSTSSGQALRALVCSRVNVAPAACAARAS